VPQFFILFLCIYSFSIGSSTMREMTISEISNVSGGVWETIGGISVSFDGGGCFSGALGGAIGGAFGGLAGAVAGAIGGCVGGGVRFYTYP
jgi:hypothetical protein